MTDLSNEEKESAINFGQAISGSGKSPSGTFEMGHKIKPMSEDHAKQLARLKSLYGTASEDVEKEAENIRSRHQLSLDKVAQREEDKALDVLDLKNTEIKNKTNLDFTEKQFVSIGGEKFFPDVDLRYALKNTLSRDTDVTSLSQLTTADDSLYIGADGTNLVAIDLPRDESGNINPDYKLKDFRQEFILPLASRVIGADIGLVYASLSSQEEKDRVQTFAMQVAYDALASDKRLLALFKQNDPEGLKKFEDQLTERNEFNGELRFPVLTETDRYGKKYYVGETYKRLRRTQKPEDQDKGFWDISLPKAISGTAKQVLEPFDEFALEQIQSFEQKETFWNRTVYFATADVAATAAEWGGAVVSKGLRTESLTKALENFLGPIWKVTPEDFGRFANFFVRMGPGDSKNGFLGYKLFSEAELTKEGATFEDMTGKIPETVKDRFLYLLAATALGRSMEFGADTDVAALRKAGRSGSDILKPGTRFVIDPITGEITSEGIEFSITDLPVAFAVIGGWVKGINALRAASGRGLSQTLNVTGRTGVSRRGMTGAEMNRDARSTRRMVEDMVDGEGMVTRVNSNFGRWALDAALTKAHQMTPGASGRLQAALFTGYGAGVATDKLLADSDLSPAAKWSLMFTANMVGGILGYPLVGNVLGAGSDMLGLTKLGSSLADVGSSAGMVGRAIFGNRDFQKLMARVARQEDVPFAQVKGYSSIMEQMMSALKYEDPDTFDATFRGQEEVQTLMDKIRKPIEDSYADNPEMGKLILATLEEAAGQATLIDVFQAARIGSRRLLKIRGTSLFSAKQLAKSINNDKERIAIEIEERNLEVALFKTLGALEKQWGAVKDADNSIGNPLRTFISNMYKKAAEPFGGVDSDGKSVLTDNFITAFSIINALENGEVTKGDATTSITELHSRLNPEQKETFVSYLMGHQGTFKDAKIESVWKNAIPAVREAAIAQRERATELQETTFEGSRLDKTPQRKKEKIPQTAESKPLAQYSLLSDVLEIVNYRVKLAYDLALGGANTGPVVTVAEVMKSVDEAIKGVKDYGLVGAQVRDSVEAATKKAKSEYDAERKLEKLDPEADAPQAEVDRVPTIQGEELSFSLRELSSIASDLNTIATKSYKSNPKRAAFYFKLSDIYRKQLDDYATKNEAFGNDYYAAKNLYKSVIAEPFRNSDLQSKMFKGKLENIILELFKGPSARENYDNLINELNKKVDGEGKDLKDSDQGAKAAKKLKAALQEALDDDFFDGPRTSDSNQRFNRLRGLINGTETSKAFAGRGVYLPSGQGGFLDLLLGTKKRANALWRDNKNIPILDAEGRLLFNESKDLLIPKDLNVLDSQLLKALLVSDEGSRKNLENSLNIAVSALIKLNQDDLKLDPKDSDVNSMTNAWQQIQKGNPADAAYKLYEEIIVASRDDPENPSAMAISKYEQMVEDAKKLLGEDEGVEFESKLKTYLAFKEYDDLKVNKPNDIERAKQDVLDIEENFARMKGFYTKIYGADQAESMEAFLQIKYLSNLETNLQITIMGELNQMSPTMALSRAWGYARGVVGARYIISEFLLRKFASSKRGNLDAVISDPEFSKAFMDMMLKEEAVDRKRLFYIKTRVIGALIGDNDDEEEANNILKGIENLFADAVAAGEDPNLIIMSLMIASLNKPFMQNLEYLYSQGVRQKLQGDYDFSSSGESETFQVPRSESLQIEIRPPRGGTQ